MIGSAKKGEKDDAATLASPYDWQWMFHFLEARTVQGIEPLSTTATAAALPLNGHAGLIAVTPDDAAQGMRVTLAGLQPVAESAWRGCALILICPATRSGSA